MLTKSIHHHVQEWIRVHMASFAVALSLAGSPVLAADESRFELHDADAGPALLKLAESGEFNVVVGPFVRTARVSIVADSIPMLLAEISNRLGAKLSRIGSVYVVHSDCSRQDPANGSKSADEEPVPEGDAPVTAQFQQIDVQSLVNAGLVPSLRGSIRENVSIVVRGVSRTDLAKAVALALRVQAAPDSVSDSTQQCRSTDSLLSLRTPPRSRTDNCPYRVHGADKACDPLEFYSVENLVPRVYMSDRDARRALIEAPDGLLASISPGDKVGRHGWRVDEISQLAVTLSRPKEGRDDRYVTSLKLKYADKSSSGLKDFENVLEKDSPLQAYEFSVGKLYGRLNAYPRMAAECADGQPDLRANMQAALRYWKKENSAIQDLVDGHFAALVRYLADDEGITPEDVRKRYEKRVDEHVESLRKEITGGSNKEACEQVFQVIVFERSVARTFASSIAELARCKSMAICPGEAQ